MKKLIYVLAAVVVLLVAAVLLLPSLIDLNDYKDEIAARVTQATGRQTEIAGDVSLSLLPSPAFSARQVRVANVEGGSAPHMVELEALQLRVEFAPLLQGSVRVEQIALVRPRILLERLESGRTNWSAPSGATRSGAGGDGDGDGASEAGGGFARQVRLDSVRVIDGTVIYRDAASGVEERVNALNAELSASSLTGPFRARGDLSTRDVPLTFQGSLGQFGGDRTTPYNLTLTMAETGAEASLAGSLSTGGEEGFALSGSLRARGDDLAAALARAMGGPASAQPVQLAQPFALSSELRYAETSLVADGLNLQLGDASAEGRATVTFGDPLDADLTLDAQRFDLDRLLAMQRAGTGGGGRTADGAAGDGADAGTGGFALPDGVRAELDLSVGATIYRDRVIRQARVNAVLADGLVTLNQAMALMPGSSDVALFGTLSGGQRGPRFDGRVEAASDNLRAVFDWLGVDASGVPSERLRRFNLLADVAGTPAQVTLTGIDLDVDSMQINGGVAVALRERPGFGIGLTVDKLNLDAYLPRPSAAEAAAAADAAATGAGDADGQGAGGVALGFLGGFDANFDLRAGELSYAGRTAQRVKLDATLHNQAIDLRELSVGDLAGASARLQGSIRELAGLDPSFDLNVDLDVQDPRRFAQLADAADAVPVGFGPVALVGTAKGRLGEVELDGTLSALGGTFTADGSLRPLAAPTAFDLVLGLRHDSLDGLLDEMPGVPRLESDPGPVELSSRVSGTAESFRTDKLKGRVGPVELTGPVGVDLTGPRPKVTAKLQTNALPIEAFALATGGGGAGGRGAGGRAEASGESGGGWSNTPMQLGGVKAVDLDLTLDSEAIAFGPKLRLEGARVAATLSDGVLDLEEASGRMFGGTFALTGTADARETLAVGGRVDAKQVDSARLLERGFDSPGIAGPVNLTADLTAKGQSERQLVESLAGQGELTGKVTVSPAAFLGPDASKLLDSSGGAKLARDLGAMLGQALGEKIRISGVTDTLDFVATSFAEEPADLSGTFAVEKGVVTTEDTTLDGRQGRARASGQLADLPNWRMDLRTRLYRAKDADGEPYVVVRQVGPLDGPNVEVTGGAFRDKLTPEALKPKRQEPKDEEPSPEAEAPAAETPQPAEDTAEPSREPAEAPVSTDAAGSDGASSDGAGEASAEAPPEKPEPAPEKPAEPKRPSAEDIIRGVLDKLKR